MLGQFSGPQVVVVVVVGACVVVVVSGGNAVVDDSGACVVGGAEHPCVFQPHPASQFIPLKKNPTMLHVVLPSAQVPEHVPVEYICPCEVGIFSGIGFKFSSVNGGGDTLQLQPPSP